MRFRLTRLRLWGLVLLCAALALGPLVARRLAFAPPQAEASVAAASVPFDASRVVEQARLAFREAPGGFEALTGTQRVEVRGHGVRVTPRDEQPDSTVAVHFETRSIRRGERELWRDHGATSRGGPAEVVTAAPEVRERLRNTTEGVEQSWAFEAPPSGEGDLVVAVAVDARCSAQTAAGLHFGAGRASVRYGHGTWIDARGLRTAVEATWRDGEVLLSVPASLVATSAFPAVLDPLISAEIAVDQPTYAASRASETTPAIAWNGVHYLVVFASGAQIVAVRVDANGVPVDPAGTTVAPDSARTRSEPDVASDGVDWYVVWSDRTATPAVYGTVVTAAGASTAPATRIRLDTQNARWDEDVQPRIAFGNGAYLVAWTLSDLEAGNEYTALGLASLSPAGVKNAEYEYYDTALRQAPDVAFDGTSFLVAWLNTDAANNNIWARAFTPATAQPIGAAFAVTSSNDVVSRPAIAWNGNRYLLAWRTFRAAPLVGALVTASPATVTPNTTTGISLTSSAVAPEDPAVAAFGTSGGGTSFLVSWREGAALRGTRLSNAGAVTDSPSLLLASGTGTRSLPTVGATSAGAVLAWEDSRTVAPDIWARSVSTTGATGTEALLSTLPPTQVLPAVGYGASTYLVVWQDGRNDVSGDIYGARVDQQGVVLDANAIPISTAPGRQASPDVTFVSAGNHFLVTWTDGRDGGSNILGARVTPAGAVLDSAGLVICDAPSSQDHPAVASNGSSALVTWDDLRNGNVDIFGTLVFPDSSVSPGPSVGLQINAGVSRQQNPAVAWNGLHYLVAWEDERSVTNFPDIYAARVAGDGTVLDSQGLVVSGRRLPDGGPMKEDRVSVAAVGDTVLVSWSLEQSTQRDVQGRLLKTSPGVDGGAAFTIASGPTQQSNPAAASDGTTFFVSWVVSTADDGSADYATWGTRIDARDGGLLDSPALALSPSTGSAQQGSPAIASAGSRAFLVAYQRFDVAPAFNTTRVRARRVSNAPPTATAASATTAEETALPLTLTGADADGDPLSVVVQAQPTHGTLSGTPPMLTYTPALNYAGPDSFTFTASDGLATSSPATVTLTVTPVNDAPTAQPQTVSTAEDTALPVTLVGSDVEGDSLTYPVVAAPSNGSLVTDGGASVTYTPNLNFFGTDSFTFQTRDPSMALSSVQTVTVNVAAVNDPPVANALSRTTNEDTAVGVVLSGSDVEGTSLTYQVVTGPANGTLSGTPPNLTYTPAANTSGTDFFTFKVNDGSVDSASAQVTLTVISVNDLPVAQNSAVATDRDTPVVITLQASDVDSSMLTYAVVTPPTNGTLSGSGNSRTYTPGAGYAGNDSFTFKANDGASDSNLATVTISVASSNRAPVATPQSVTTPEDTNRTITVAGTDADGDALTFSIVTQPTNGTVTGMSPNFIYQPRGQFSGSDSFTFKATDPQPLDSAPATVTITVTAVNDAPVAASVNLSVAEDSALTFTLSGSDVEGSPLTYSVTTQPVNGTLTGTPPMLQYQPAANFSGNDSIQFTVNDGTLTSAPGTVAISVTPVNDAPVAQPQSVSTPQDTPRAITLVGTDIDSSALTYVIVTQPANGTLSGTPPTVTYTPNPNFRGNDSFSFKVNDGVQDSAATSVGISVSAVNHAPVAASANLATAEDETLAVTLAATDQDGDPLTYRVTSPPSKGTLTGTPPSLTYTPNANETGVDTFLFRANDGTVDSNEGTVRVTVTPVNDPPVASAQQVTTPEDTAVSIVLVGTDPDPMDPLTWTITTPPSQGTLTGNPPNLTYTPRANYGGPDSLTFRVADGSDAGATATVDLTVTPVNDAPSVGALSTSTVEGTPVTLTLEGSDVEGDALTFAVSSEPTHGALTGTPPELTYTPEPGFTGTDTFSFTAHDGTATSLAGTVTITVTPAGGGVTTRDTTRLNGWSCGCSAGPGDAGSWALGLLGLGALRRRRSHGALGLLGLGALRRRRSGGALALAALLVLPAAALAKPTPAKKSATKKAAPAPVPAPAHPPPPEAPAKAPEPPPVTSAPTPKGLPNLAALDVVISVPSEKLDGVAFTELLTSAVDQSKLFKVVSSRDIASMLGLERQKALLGCSDDTSCLTEVADALGTDYVMQGTVGKVGATYLVTVRLIDSKRSRVVGRGANQTDDANLLLNLLWKSTQQALDGWGATLPPEEASRVAARPKIEPVTAVAPSRSKLGVVVAVVGGYQPLAAAGSRGSVGGEVAASWRIGRIDLGAGVVISPTPGARLFGMFALTEGRHRVSLGLRASAFPGPQVFGGGPAAEYELGLGEYFGIRVLGAGEVYGSQQGVVLALLAGLGASARF